MYLSEGIIDRASLRLSLLTCLMGLVIAGCSGEASHRTQAQAGGGGNPVADKVALSVEVSSFKEKAIYDEFMSGDSMGLDLAVLTVMDGPFKGHQLNVVRSETTSEEPWTKVGSHCLVTVDRQFLGEKDLLIPSKQLEIRCRP